jgi:CBS-domain-containing membrane protein
MSAAAQIPLKRLQSLFVADIMSHDVAVIPETASMDDAAAILTVCEVSGAPVVDQDGCCIGVLSTTDFARFDRIDAALARGIPEENRGVERRELPWNSVQRYMTTPVHTVSPAASMMHAAELMCAAHVHRLIVLDEYFAPVGLVSTLDIVSALIHADHEDLQERRCIDRSR